MTTSQTTGHHGSPSSAHQLAAPTPMVGPFLTEQQLASRWLVNPGSLANQRSRGRNLVPFVRLMGRVRYRLVDVEAYESGLEATAA